ncbi:inorganic pyrophosphatase 2-like protein [Tanacetum coccineum]
MDHRLIALMNSIGLVGAGCGNYQVLPPKPKKMSGRLKKKTIRAPHETNYPNKISRCDLRIVSDANTFFIETVLKHLGIRGCFSEINTNPGFVDEEGKLRISLYHDFHNLSHGCTLCPANMCKGEIIERIQSTFTTKEKRRVIYLGDGAGNFCPTLKLVEGDYMMPREDFQCQYGSLRIVFDPRKSLGYKVFHAQKKSDDFCTTRLQVFCSEKDDWSDCAEVYPVGLFVGFGFGVCWNDEIHWLNIMLGEQPTHYKLGYLNERPVLTKMELPRLYIKLYCDIKMFESRGSLLLICSGIMSIRNTWDKPVIEYCYVVICDTQSPKQNMQFVSEPWSEGLSSTKISNSQLGGSWMDSRYCYSDIMWHISRTPRSLLILVALWETCVAIDEWVEYPMAHTALDDILPCVGNETSQENLPGSKDVTFQLVGMVKMGIMQRNDTLRLWLHTSTVDVKISPWAHWRDFVDKRSRNPTQIQPSKTSCNYKYLPPSAPTKFSKLEHNSCSFFSTPTMSSSKSQSCESPFTVTKPLRRTVSCVDPSEFKSLIRLAKPSNSSSLSAKSNQKKNHKQNSQMCKPNNKQNDQVSNENKIKKECRYHRKESTLALSFDNLQAKRSRLMKTSLMRVSSVDGDIVKQALESWITHPTSEQKHGYANMIRRIQKRYMYF